MWHHIAYILGLTDPNSPWYLLWSGFGANFNPDPAIWFAVGLWYWHHLCHEDGCYRHGKYQKDGKPTCKKHH